MATNLQFIKSASGTSVSSLSVTDCFSDKYNVYQVLVTEAVFTVNVNPRIRVINTSGIDTGANYDWASLITDSVTTFGQNRFTNSDHYGHQGVVAANATLGTGTSLYVYNPYNSSSYTFFQTQNSSTYLGNHYGYKTIGVHKVAEQITGIVLNALTGTLSGTVEVYGVK
jgi:hypothetical protein